ncbi:hypothetical protein [Fortiea contorta]|uniref:hypothetical protein n=1 Tax=Fortiea contorta TaxID=1892405 RepID=UPI00034C025A|nr:hypothetical protein [Fortiea contorta]
MKSPIRISSLLKDIRKFPQGLMLILILTSLLSCGLNFTDKNPSAAAPSPEATQSSPDSHKLPQNISTAVLRDASKRSGIKIAKLQITDVTPETFGNACIFNFGEVCTREYKPIVGWQVTVKVKEASWIYHVNKSGSQIVLDPQVNASTNIELPKAIANKILKDAAQRSRLAMSNLKITEVKPITFGNACEFNFGEICPQIYQPLPGWEVVVEVRRQLWTYHVNQSASQMVLDPKISATSKN